MKYKKSIIKLLVMILLLNIILPIFNSVIAATYKVEYLGKVTYSSSKVGNFKVNGKQAFCTDHNKKSPPSGTEVTNDIYENSDIVKCLYYGWGGAEPWDFKSFEQGIVYTSLAIDHFKNGNANKTAKDFINYVESMPVPCIDLNFSQNNLDAFLEGSFQRTQSIKVNGSKNYYLTIDLPDEVILVNETRNNQYSGKVDVYGEEQFYLKAPLHISGRWISNDINNHKYNFQPIIYKSNREDYQVLASEYQAIVDPSSTINLSVNWLSTGSIEIHKLDEQTGAAISDTVFELRDLNNAVVKTLITDSNGTAFASGLIADKYKLIEIKSNDNYILDSTPLEIMIAPGETKTIDVANEHQKGNIKIYKVDKDNKKIVLENVEFKLYSEEFGKIIGTYYTNEKGEIEIKNLRTGDYKLIETKTNKWYNLAKDTEIKVEWDKETTKEIENELKKGQIRVIKVDKDNNEIKLKGVEFDVLNEDNKVLEKIITDENGEALTSKYAIRDFSKLKLRETKTLDTYVLSDKVETIELQENQITNVKFENERIKGKVEITKVDSKDENKKLEGAKFGLYNEENKLIEILITSENGTAISKNLYKGKYFLRELDTGSNYYLLNEDTFEFEIINNGETIEKIIKNEPTDITVDVDKKGTTEIKPGEEVNYEFSNIANNSNVYLDNFKWYDYIPTDYIRLQKMTTGTWNQELTYKVYYKTNKSNEYILFKEELKTTENYVIDFTQITLLDDEYITETLFDFGKVEKGFKEAIKPTMNCKSFDTLKRDDIFTNYTKTVGIYFGITAEANSKWTTIIHITKDKHEILLPRTGK